MSSGHFWFKFFSAFVIKLPFVPDRISGLFYLRQQFRGAWGNVPNKHRGFVRVFQNAAQYTVLAIFSAAFHAAVPVGFIADFSCVMQEIGAVRLSVSFMPPVFIGGHIAHAPP